MLQNNYFIINSAKILAILGFLADFDLLAIFDFLRFSDFGL